MAMGTLANFKTERRCFWRRTTQEMLGRCDERPFDRQGPNPSVDRHRVGTGNGYSRRDHFARGRQDLSNRVDEKFALSW